MTLRPATPRGEEVLAANPQGLTTRMLEFTMDRGVPWARAKALYEEEVGAAAPNWSRPYSWAAGLQPCVGAWCGWRLRAGSCCPHARTPGTRPPTRPQIERVRAEEGEEGVRHSIAGFYWTQSATTTHWVLVGHRALRRRHTLV